MERQLFTSSEMALPVRIQNIPIGFIQISRVDFVQIVSERLGRLLDGCRKFPDNNDGWKRFNTASRNESYCLLKIVSCWNADLSFISVLILMLFRDCKYVNLIFMTS